MNKINDKKRQALHVASQSKRQRALDKVKVTLHLMKEKKLPINFNSVAMLAGVSKTWLYRQEELKAEIDDARNKSGKIRRVIDSQAVLKTKKAEILALQNENRKLRATVKELRDQLETIYGELYRVKNVQNV
jgi:hypothetical protein